MPISRSDADASGVSHDRGYHALPIKRIVHETAEACSIVLDIPPELHAAFQYASGQFVTFRVTIDGQKVYRSYSMSSAPGIDADLAVTVKRVPDGLVSNWLNDHLSAGDTVEASVPSGLFTLGEHDRPIVAFAAGSGITPIFSIIKTALAGGARDVHLLYANRDRDSVIFAAELEQLAAAYPGRLAAAHHLDVESGFIDASSLEPYLELAAAADTYICGPGPFMDLIEGTLLDAGVALDQIHIERFKVAEPLDAPPPAAPEAAETSDCQVTIELDGKTLTATHHPGSTILQTARSLGMSPPYSCEMGNCATCMAMCVEGAVSMYVNDALFDDEVEQGWILTCQSVPTTPTVHVIYGYEGE